MWSSFFKNFVKRTLGLGLIIGLYWSVSCAENTGNGSSSTESIDDLENSSGDAFDVAQIPPTDLLLSPRVSSTVVGESVYFSVFGLFPYNQSLDIQTLTEWSMDVSGIVEFKENGRFLALAPGSVEIRAEYLGVFKTAQLTVEEAKLSTLAIFPKGETIGLEWSNGELEPVTRTFRAVGIKSDGSINDVTEQVTWEVTSVSGETGEATTAVNISADKKGQFLFREKGTFNISVAYEGLETEESVNVAAPESGIASIQVVDEPIRVAIGRSQDLRIFVTYDDLSTEVIDTGFELVSSQSVVASVSDTTALGLAIGQSVFEVTYQGVQTQTTVIVEPPVVDSINISPATINTRVGLEETLSIEATYSDGSLADITRFAELDSNGSTFFEVREGPKIRGLVDTTGNPVQLLTVRYGGTSQNVAVLVEEAGVSSLEVTPSTLSIQVGEVQDFTVTGRNSDGSTLDLTSAANYAMLNSFRADLLTGFDARVQGKNAGETILSITYVDPISTKNLVATVPITVVPASLDSIYFSPGADTQPLGRFTDFVLRAVYSDGSEEDITEVAQYGADISSGGMSLIGDLSLTAIGRLRLQTTAEGQMKILASYEGQTTEATYTVLPKVLDEVTIVRQGTYTSAGALDVGETIKFKAIATYSDMSVEDVTTDTVDITTVWTPPNGSIASFVDDGSNNKDLTGISEGDAGFSVSITYASVTEVASFGLGVYTPCSSPGQQESYYCWFLGENNESCDTVCKGHGLNYNVATQTYAGSGATGDQCRNLLKNRFNSAVKNYSGNASFGQGLGCSIYTFSGINLGLRDGEVTTISSAREYVRRVCACEP